MAVMNSFFERHTESISDGTHLAMRECLHGMLCKKDIGDGVIHSSDFRKAVVDLGLPLGHAIVEDVLVFCKIDNDKGTMNFTELARELSRRRQRYNEDQEAMRKKNVKVKESSYVGAMINKSEHWRAQQEHNKRQEIGRYNLKLKKFRPEISAIYTKYSNHELTPTGVLEELKSSLDIAPNRHFQLLIEDHKAKDDLSFRQFLNGLYKYDPHEAIDDIRSRAAGATNAATGLHHMERTVEDLVQKPIKRTNLESRKTMQARSDADGARTFSGRKEAILNDVNPYQNKGLYTDSSQVQKALLRDNTDTDMMMTHNQRQMYKGSNGEELNIKFNVEMKLLREQVLAGLRKLDAGEFTMSDFLSKIYDLGLHIEPVILKNLKDQLTAGRINWKHIIHLLDVTIFRKKAVYDRPPEEEVSRVKEKFTTLLLDTYGHGAFIDLISLFHMTDEDNSHSLSFFEFKKACTEHGMAQGGEGQSSSYDTAYYMTESELRVLFHALDLDGSGQLDIYEFVGGLRNEMSPQRKAKVREAYLRMDTLNKNAVSTEAVEKQMQPCHHPDVKLGFKTEHDVLDAMVEFFELTAAALNEDENAPVDMVSYDQFSEYWTNISSEITDDADFIRTITDCMQITAMKPRPAMATISKTAELSGEKLANDSVQIHGDIVTWSQEPSQMELDAQAKRQRRTVRRTAGKLNNFTDYRYHSQMNIFATEGRDAYKTGSGGGGYGDKTGPAGKLTKAREVMIHSNDTSKLTLWDTSKKGLKAQKEDASQALEDALGSMYVSTSRVASGETKLDTTRDEFGEVLVPAGAPSGLFTVADADSLVHVKKRNDGPTQKNYGGAAPWLTEEEDRAASSRYTTKKVIKPLREFAPGKLHHSPSTARVSGGSGEQEQHHVTSLRDMLGNEALHDNRYAGAIPPPPPSSSDAAAGAHTQAVQTKKRVSLMEFAEAKEKKAGGGQTLAEMYGM